MKHRIEPQHDEPVGIVISRGWEPENAPRFTAFVWSYGPEDELEEEVQAA